MKKILVVSHCILNHAAKVKTNEADLEEEYRQRRKLLELVLEQDIQLLQLPCPEFLLYGSARWGHVKNQFMHPHFRKSCKNMLEPVLDQMEEYLAYPEEFELIGIVSVEGSPSCGYHQTCKGEWGGEFTDEQGKPVTLAKVTMENEPGAFMEVLEKEMQQRLWNVPILSMKEAICILYKDSIF